MKAILLAPVDLLWNGGIGTYVKASTETHAEVGDKSNDGIRVNGRQLRCTVVGEGGNLGLTQRGRIEYAQIGGPGPAPSSGGLGGRISTDFIDNSAGVDCSDHEVNIKILLGAVVADGELTMPERDTLLAEMTDEVGALCLRDNYEQASALGSAMAQAHSLLPVHRRLISDLEKRGRLDRALEFLPTDEELAARGEAGRGLTQPEFAVLLAYVKIDLEAEIIGSSLPDDPWTAEVLANYFPAPLRARYADRMAEHRLHRDIITTVLVNDVVNHGGITFVYRAAEESGASVADVIRAYVIVREVYGLRDVWKAVEALDRDGRVPTKAQTAVYLETRRLMDRAMRWLLSSRRAPLDVPTEISRLRPGVAELLPNLDVLFRGNERESLRLHAEAIVRLGIPSDLAAWATRIMYGFGLLDVVTVAESTGHDVTEVAGVYFALSEQFRADMLLSSISDLPRDDRWQTLARMALRYDLYAALAGLTTEVLTSTAAGIAPEERVAQWEQSNEIAIARAQKSMAEFDDARADLASLSVLLRQIRTLVQTSSA